ncbi:MAG: T9SS type A sorting domain-containing protein [Leptolyngbya sp. SIO3F4]|nr:T9SS type A sorting domain-containing protein [Leptolyngbya sp. SIO3F4]
MLFFSGIGNGLGDELWMSDGTESGTRLLKDINPGALGSSPTSFVTLPNGNVVFTAIDDAHGYELWITDGTETGTSLLSDIYNGGTSSNPEELTLHNGSVFFRARDVANGFELWISDGTTAGTSLVKNIDPNVDGTPRSLTSALNLLFFRATENGDVEPWISNGTTGGTVRLKDVATGAAASFPDNFTVFNGALYFSASDANGDVGLWKTNGTEATTVLVTNIGPDLGGGNRPSTFTVADGVLYFFADDGNGRQLWKSDGTAGGTRAVSSLDGVGFGPLVAYQGVLFFPATGLNRNREELWTYRPATDDLAIYVDISGGASGPELTNPDQLTVFDGKLFFSAEVDGSGDRQLFVSDGVNFLVIERVAPDIAPETNNIPIGPSSAFVEYKGNLYVAANFNSAGMELWRIEGTNVSIDEHTHTLEGVEVYPQPAGDGFTLSLAQATDATSYQVVSLSGSVVHSGSINGTLTYVDISHLAAGSYIIELLDGAASKHHQLIVVQR